MMTETGRRAISEFLQSRVGGNGVPAVTATVVDRAGILYLESFGKRDVTHDVAATADTIFRIASMTKPVTSLAAMVLVDESRIALDDPLTKHLPDYRQP